jgi:hypothetical protein
MTEKVKMFAEEDIKKDSGYLSIKFLKNLKTKPAEETAGFILYYLFSL